MHRGVQNARVDGTAHVTDANGQKKDVVLMMDCVQRENEFIDTGKCQDAQSNWNNIGHRHFSDGRCDPCLPFGENVTEPKLVGQSSPVSPISYQTKG